VEVDLDAQQRVLAALATAAGSASAAAPAAAEERLEDVAEAAEARPRAAERRAGAAEVVLLALRRVGEHVVRVRHELEPLGRLGRRVHVGVEFAGEPAVRLLDLLGARVSGDAEHLVVVSHGLNVLSIRDAGAGGPSSRAA